MPKKNEQKESKFANFIGTTLIIICVPLLIVFATIAIKANINHDHLPDFMGYKPQICASNSMENMFVVGDVTISKAVEENQLNQGDIITFWDVKHDKVYTHRIAEIKKDENNKKIYLTKGDMNSAIDPDAVEFDRIEGKYVGKIKYIGKLILAIQKPTGLIVAFLIPVIITALIYRHDIKVKDKKNRRKEKLLKRLDEKQKQ